MFNDQTTGQSHNINLVQSNSGSKQKLRLFLGFGFFFFDEPHLLAVEILGSIVVSIPACHARKTGIRFPAGEVIFFFA